MKTRIPGISIFVLGLAAVCWVGLGYLGSNLPALAVTALIAALYLTGALELYRYHQATGSLDRALAALDQDVPGLDAWLAQLHPSLRSAVRLRVEGERAGLPAPALTPYLVGMLVLLGMLGTLLGMVLTLRGTGMALQTATDLQAVRDSLAAPVSGLGVAFGASIAGVASSAALGLLSALLRRERSDAVQRLDAHIATTLRGHSRVHQREQALELLQQQTAAMPTLVERLDTMAAALERQSQAAHEQQARQQEAFHESTRNAYRELAESVGRSLQTSAAEGARLAGLALAPTVESTLAGIARQATAMHQTVAGTSERHLQALSSELTASVGQVSDTWQQAVAAQTEANQAQAAELKQALQAFDTGAHERAQALLERISERMQAVADGTAAGWAEALSGQQAGHEALVARQQQALDAAAEAFTGRAAGLLDDLARSQARLQAELAERDGQRLTEWRAALATIGEELQAQWTRAAAQAQAHANDTVAEVSSLMQAAAEGPRAAAETIAELRNTLSESMARDSAMLEERTRMLETLDTLLQAVNRASGEQRSAIDALVSTSSELLERVGARFDAQIETGSAQLEQASGRLDAGAGDIAALGQSLGDAAQAFAGTSAGLVERLQAIEGALDRSLARSDEQLAYYVAQAREVVDLSVLAQREIIGNLQQLAGEAEPARTGTA